MNQDFTDSGISCIGSLPWGTHFCHFYDAGEDLADTLVPYFKAGLENGEGCLWVASPPFGVEDATAALRNAVPDLDRHMKRFQIEIVDHRDWYTPRGYFDAETVLAGWIAKEAAALARGHSGLRVTGNTFWIEGHDGFKSFVDYEARLNAGFKQHRMVCVCSYCLARTTAIDVLDVVRTHEFAVARRDGQWDVVESAALKMAKDQLRCANEQLEAKVVERTSHLQRALADKEVLLREIHHRVKNNLQIINSLLVLKKRGLAACGGQHIVEDILRRINAIGLVHESLYLKDDTHHIDFTAYLSDLGHQLVSSYGLEGRVGLRVNAARGFVGLNDAIPVGLIATEVITNALKHGFPDGRCGDIEIAFSSRSRTGNVLTIHDTGIGLPADRPAGQNGTGMTLIDRLAAQVGGTATFSQGSGTTFILRFPVA